ncbi:phosphoprotein [Nariva virus]|uniref:Phosphoprotein n=1 Tax=Nariva virus TaxID=590647 RepID=B8XH59_9MONO|nr:phosphoprotein [Nariva virus]ACL97354.1 phosphoprotein [Nariva virus]
METNGQKVIRDALQVLAVVKETDSPTTENQCGRRLSVQGVTTQTSTTDPETKGESGSEEESGSGWGGEGNSSQEASGSNQLVDNAERYGEGESKGPQGPGGFDGVHDSPVRQDHPDEGIRREPCYVLLGAASGGAYLSESEGEGSPTRGSPVGESGDAKVIAPPNRGSTINDNPSCDDVKESLGFISQPKPRRLTGIDTSTDTGTPIPPPRDYTKRGIDGSTVSHGQTAGFLLNPGAIPCVPVSHHFLDVSRVSAGSAQCSARNVLVPVSRKRTSTMTSASELAIPERATSDRVSSDEPYCTSLSANSSFIDPDNLSTAESALTLLNEILDNQRTILVKLKALEEVKTEVEVIKKTLSKHGLALSTLEGQISCVMIAIPSSGRSDAAVDPKPDLKPLLGRDKGRGINDAARPKGVNVSFESGSAGSWKASSTSTVTMEPKPGVFPEPIDPDKTNAAGFKPTGTNVSREVVLALIETRIKDPRVAERMISILSHAKTPKQLQEVHDAILAQLRKAKQ